MNKILLFEKNEFFRESLRRIIECRFPDAAVKFVLTRKDCLTLISTFIPDVLLLGLKSYSGIELSLVDQIHQQHPSVSILLLTDYNIDEYRKEAILKGASHIIPRELWTGNEILALIGTILTAKESLTHILAEGQSARENFLEQPIERRKRDANGRNREREFLAYNPDRRKGVAV